MQIKVYEHTNDNISERPTIFEATIHESFDNASHVRGYIRRLFKAITCEDINTSFKCVAHNTPNLFFASSDCYTIKVKGSSYDLTTNAPKGKRGGATKTA